MSALSGTSAANPDLDWSQLRETILMLNLAIAQIDQSMNEGSASVSTLSSSFTVLATNLSDIQTAIAQLDSEQTHRSNEDLKKSIQASAITASDNVKSSIVAFQFYDKLSQRLDHVSQSLADLTTLIADPSSLYSPVKWQALQTSIRSKYTMEEERRMFDNVLSGMPVEQALLLFRQEFNANKTASDDDIELF
ncbi:hypothetical protein [Thalassotalea sediminis]|uniref:hypothetical protein n=1 Tax=Thalassotalea sediminis TaxID=1759089 RepID=UPI00257273C7|nr:hypothetical protein [Thalassotalea sediminis]